MKTGLHGVLVLTLALAGCNPRGGDDAQSIGMDEGARHVEQMDGGTLTHVATSEESLIIGEPSNPPEADANVVAILLRPSVTTDSECYTCWRRYYACIFGGGANCTDIGRQCDGVCKRERGGAVVMAATTLEQVATRMRATDTVVPDSAQ